MTYKDADFTNEQDGKSISTRSRVPKIDADKEEGILATLSELAFRGTKSSDYGVVPGRKAKKRREEKGFRGTFLQSSPAAISADNEVPHEEGIENQSALPADVTAKLDAEEADDRTDGCYGRTATC